MRVALLSEGAYPYVPGEVSTWCDRLVRGLPQHAFDLVSVTGTEPAGPVLELPCHVRSLTALPLWRPLPPAGRGARRRSRGLLPAYGGVLRNALDTAAPPGAFAGSLRELAALARGADLSVALRTDEAVDLLLETWGALDLGPLTVREALSATDLVEHFLRPLTAPVARADVCHAVSHGLPALLGLLAAWEHGTPLVLSRHDVFLQERYLGFRQADHPWAVKLVLVRLFRQLGVSASAAASAVVPVGTLGPADFGALYESLGSAPAHLPVAA